MNEIDDRCSDRAWILFSEHWMKLKGFYPSYRDKMAHECYTWYLKGWAD